MRVLTLPYGECFCSFMGGACCRGAVDDCERIGALVGKRAAFGGLESLEESGCAWADGFPAPHGCQPWAEVKLNDESQRIELAIYLLGASETTVLSLTDLQRALEMRSESSKSQVAVRTRYLQSLPNEARPKGIGWAACLIAAARTREFVSDLR